MPSKTKILAIQQINLPVRIWNMKDNCNILNNLIKIEVCVGFHQRVIWRFVSPKCIELCMERPSWCKHGSCKVTETFCHCILLFKWNAITLELRHMEINTTSRARNVQLAKTYTITNLLICVRALFGCHSMSWIIN